MNSNDQDLRESFDRLRKADHASAPEFRHVLVRARHAKASTRSSVPWRWAAGIATAAFAIVALTPVLKPRPSLAQALPELLKTDAHPEPILTQLTDAKPGAGSDFLLPFRLDLASL